MHHELFFLINYTCLARTLCVHKQKWNSKNRKWGHFLCFPHGRRLLAKQVSLKYPELNHTECIQTLLPLVSFPPRLNGRLRALTFLPQRTCASGGPVIKSANDLPLNAPVLCVFLSRLSQLPSKFYGSQGCHFQRCLPEYRRWFTISSNAKDTLSMASDQQCMTAKTRVRSSVQWKSGLM